MAFTCFLPLGYRFNVRSSSDRMDAASELCLFSLHFHSDNRQRRVVACMCLQSNAADQENQFPSLNFAPGLRMRRVLHFMLEAPCSQVLEDRASHFCPEEPSCSFPTGEKSVK